MSNEFGNRSLEAQVEHPKGCARKPDSGFV